MCIKSIKGHFLDLVSLMVLLIHLINKHGLLLFYV